MKIEKIGILVGGGPAPGINNVIHTICSEAKRRRITTIGFRDGAAGLLRRDYVELTPRVTYPSARQGGVLLRTSRTTITDKVERVITILKQLGVHVLFTIGGDDTIKTAHQISVKGNFLVIHIPKTIDNDISGTDITFGYTTFVEKASQLADTFVEEALAARVHVCTEVMGRGCGAITLGIFQKCRAKFAIIPEEPPNLALLTENLKQEDPCLILVAEGSCSNLFASSLTEKRSIREKLTGHFTQEIIDSHVPMPDIDPFGHVRKGGIAKILVQEFQRHNLIVKQMPDLGYGFRCADPIKFDLELTSNMVKHAFIGLVEEGKPVSVMVAVNDGQFISIPLMTVVGKTRTLLPSQYSNYLQPGSFLIK